jgi:hypothetical protein
MTNSSEIRICKLAAAPEYEGFEILRTGSKYAVFIVVWDLTASKASF